MKKSLVLATAFFSVTSLTSTVFAGKGGDEPVVIVAAPAPLTPDATAAAAAAANQAATTATTTAANGKNSSGGISGGAVAAIGLGALGAGVLLEKKVKVSEKLGKLNPFKKRKAEHASKKTKAEHASPATHLSGHSEHQGTSHSTHESRPNGASHMRLV